MEHNRDVQASLLKPFLLLGLTRQLCFKLLTTSGAFMHRLALVTWGQLAQSILKVDFVQQKGRIRRGGKEYSQNAMHIVALVGWPWPALG